MFVLAAVLSMLNARFTKLPQTIGLTLMGAALSILVIVISKIFPDDEEYPAEERMASPG